MWCSTAEAMAAPSRVAVPRPSSSNATSDLLVALWSIAAVSASSTKNVDWPVMMWSLAPMRTKMASTGERVRLSAGTQPPICASKAARHTCRSSVLFPPMLGPVRTMKAGCSGPPRDTSLGTKEPSKPGSPEGWRSPLASNTGGPLTACACAGGSSFGLHTEPSALRAWAAKLMSASSSATASTALTHSSRSSTKRRTMPCSTTLSAASRSSSASRSSLDSCASRSVV
mmetsp:Transcript_21648/g.60053  ORF Transcript_21648/g.60053 Transcript_21648/m.60053 type:complete len:228 (-) Transcript_21648:1265-1948(-)